MHVLTPVVKRDYPLIDNWLYVGRGINLRQKKKGELHIYLKERNTHLLGLGRTRWGKTEFIARTSADDVEFGNSLFCIDPKGSYDWLEKIAYVAYKVGRLKELMIFDLVHHNVSVRINPLQTLRPEKIGEFFFRLAPESEDRFFPDVARDIAYTVSLVFYAMGKTDINVWDIYQNSGVEDFARLERELLNYVPKTDREKALYQRYYRDALVKVRKIAKKDKAYWSKVNTSFEVSVSQIATGDVGHLFGKARENPLLDKLLAGEPIIFFAYLGVLEVGEETGRMVARLLSSITHHAYGLYYSDNRVMLPPVAEYWDEASNVFYDGAQDKFNKAGGVNCYLHAFTQSLADPEKVVGKELTKILQDNANLILFSVIDADTQKYFEQMFGYYKGYDIIWKKDDFDLVQVEKPLVPADAFARLWKGAFHAIIEARYYRGYSPMLEVPPVWLYPLPYPEKRIIEKRFGIDARKATPEQKAYAREVARDKELFIKENEKYNFFSGIVIDLTELEYYEEFVLKHQVKGVELKKEEEEESVNTSPAEDSTQTPKEQLEEETLEEETNALDLTELFGEEEDTSPTQAPQTESSDESVDEFFGVEEEDELTKQLKEFLKDYPLNQLIKGVLYAFKKGDSIYFQTRKLKKYVGNTDSFKHFTVRYYNTTKSGIKIPKSDFFCAIPAFKLGLEGEADSELVEQIKERESK